MKTNALAVELVLSGIEIPSSKYRAEENKNVPKHSLILAVPSRPIGCPGIQLYWTGYGKKQDRFLWGCSVASSTPGSYQMEHGIQKCT